MSMSGINGIGCSAKSGRHGCSGYGACICACSRTFPPATSVCTNSSKSARIADSEIQIQSGRAPVKRNPRVKRTEFRQGQEARSHWVGVQVQARPGSLARFRRCRPAQHGSSQQQQQLEVGF